jgi:2-deoxy-scyllo-inosamine dehydrogenase (SAM-dependent)/8-amino-3,8-dideoxy-alpha-D-manno-octulosonate transaminase
VESLDFDRAIPLFERLEIESVSNCNRDCWFCPRSYDRSGTYLNAAGERTFEAMPTGMVLNILEQAQALGFAGEVTFHFFSEPLLDERNPSFAREARRRGMRPFLHTNGDVLRNNAALCEEVKAVYDHIVVGVYDYENEEELQSEKAFWLSTLAGADLRFSYIAAAGARGAPNLGVPRAWVPPDARMTLPDLVFDHAPCSRPLQRMLIRYDGRIANCCEDMKAEFELGSVYEHTLEELWFSSRHVEVVRDLLAGRRARYELCKRCPLPPTGAARAGERIRFRPRC